MKQNIFVRIMSKITEFHEVLTYFLKMLLWFYERFDLKTPTSPHLWLLIISNTWLSDQKNIYE